MLTWLMLVVSAIMLVAIPYYVRRFCALMKRCSDVDLEIANHQARLRAVWNRPSLLKTKA